MLITVILYFAMPKKFRWIILLISSYVFYLLSDFLLIFFIVVTTLSVYGCALWFERINTKSKDYFSGEGKELSDADKKLKQKKFNRQKKWILFSVIVLNLGILSFYKFFADASIIVNNALSWASISNMDGIIGRTNILIPLGISYYTFQSIGYLVDVYYGRYKPEKNVAKFALFTSFFPQLVQGPISKYSQLSPQLLQGHEFSPERTRDGVLLISYGIIKTQAIASVASSIFSTITKNIMNYSFIEVLIAFICFMIYAYCSFSGGIDIARGTAQIFGINLTDNFQRPHFAKSVGDYWRRWHITLGGWMKEYVMYPITLSKPFNKLNKKFRQKFPNNFGKIFLTCVVTVFIFLLVGIWHGLELKWVFFGLYNGFFVSLGVFLAAPAKKWSEKHPKWTTKNIFLRIGSSMLTMFIIFWSKVVTSASDLKTGFSYVARVFTSMTTKFNSFQYVEPWHFVTLITGIVLLFVIGIIQEKGIKIRAVIGKQHVVVRWLIYIAIIFALIILCEWNVSGNSGGGFIYDNV